MKDIKMNELSDAELDKLVEEKRKELFEVRSEYKQMRSVEKPHRMKTLRKDIARIYTFKTKRQGAQGA